MATEMDWQCHDESLGGVLSDFFESPEVRARMGAGHTAGLAWHSVIGDIERKHTTGVFVGKPKAPGMAPALCVYVDSRMRMVDFNANREIYLARLTAAGYDYSCGMGARGPTSLLARRKKLTKGLSLCQLGRGKR